MIAIKSQPKAQGSTDTATTAPPPRHVAIIMDGNGRWAQRRGQERIFGHQRGAETARRIVSQGARLGLAAMTLYSFSLENWKRPPAEVAFLMELCTAMLQSERRLMLENNIRFAHIGRRQGLPDRVLKELDETLKATESHTGMTLAIALNYGGRGEITDAVKQIAADVAAGRLRPDQITEQTLHQHLYHPELPDPDLLIRTAGEMRISNFLLWQISYSELWITPKLWPDFSEEDLQQALQAYSERQRRFGGADVHA